MTAQNFKIAPLSPLYEFSLSRLPKSPPGGNPLGNPVLDTKQSYKNNQQPELSLLSLIYIPELYLN